MLVQRAKKLESMERELFGEYYDKHVENKRQFELKNEINNINASIHLLSEQMVNLQNTSNEIKQDTSEISVISSTLTSAHNDIKGMNKEMKKSFAAIKNQLKGWCTNSSLASKLVCIILFIVSMLKLIIFINYLYFRIYRLIARSSKHLNMLKHIPFISVFAGIIDLGIELVFFALFFVLWAFLTKGLGGVEAMEQCITVMWHVLCYVLSALYKILTDFYNSESEFRQIYYRIFNKPLADINNGYKVVFDLASAESEKIMKFTNDYLVNQTQIIAEQVATKIGDTAFESVNEMPTAALNSVKSALGSVSEIPSAAFESVKSAFNTVSAESAIDNVGSTLRNVGSTFKNFLKWGGGKSKKRKTYRKNKRTKTSKRYRKTKGGGMNKLPLLNKLIKINTGMITLGLAEYINVLSIESSSPSKSTTGSRSRSARSKSAKSARSKSAKSASSRALHVNITPQKIESILDIAEAYTDILIKMMFFMEEMNNKIEENPSIEPSAVVVREWTDEILMNGFDEEGNFYCDEYCTPRQPSLRTLSKRSSLE